jgi:hypothetical protein
METCAACIYSTKQKHIGGVSCSLEGHPQIRNKTVQSTSPDCDYYVCSSGVRAAVVALSELNENNVKTIIYNSNAIQVVMFGTVDKPLSEVVRMVEIVEPFRCFVEKENEIYQLSTRISSSIKYAFNKNSSKEP